MARMYIHVRRRGRMRQAGRKISVSKRRKTRRDETRRGYDELDGVRNRDREDTALNWTGLQRSAAHTAQADRFDIRKRSGWLVLDDDDIRTHSHDSTVQSKRLA